MEPFSRRSAAHGAPSAFAQAVALAEAREPLVDLTLTNPTRAGLPGPPGAALASLGADPIREYHPAPFGLPTARQAVAATLGADPERVILTASTSEAYGLLFRLLCDPGDAVLAARPSYPLFDHLAQFDGVRLRPYPLELHGEWWPSLPETADEDVRALLVVSPNNPTGTVFGADDWSAARRLGRPVIIDEVFAPYALEGPPSAGAAADLPLRFVLGGLSKSCGLPQMKLGWIRVEGEERLVGEALARLEVLADAYLSVGTPVQHAAPALLAHGATFRAATLPRLRANLSTLRDVARDTAMSVPRVDGGWYACVRMPATRTDEEWALALLDRGVRVQPGYLYDLHPGEWLVLSLLTEETSFTEGVAALRELVG